LIWAKENLTNDEVNKLFLAKDNQGRTVFHVATYFCKLELLQEIMNWTKNHLTREEVLKLLLVTDNEGRTVLHVAAEFYKQFFFQG
jgi:DNA repair protein RadC